MAGTQRPATEGTTDTLSLMKQVGKQYDGCSERAGVTEEGRYSWRQGTQARTRQGRNTPNMCSCCCFLLVEPGQKPEGKRSQLLLWSVGSASWGTSRAKDTEQVGEWGRGGEKNQYINVTLIFSYSTMRLLLSNILPSTLYLSHSKFWLQDFRQGQFQNILPITITITC